METRATNLFFEMGLISWKHFVASLWPLQFTSFILHLLRDSLDMSDTFKLSLLYMATVYLKKY